MALTVQGVARIVACPYCNEGNELVVRRPRQHYELVHCGSCGGTFAVRIDVTIKLTSLTVEGEVGRERAAEPEAERG